MKIFLLAIFLLLYSNTNSQSIESYYLDKYPQGAEYDSLIRAASDKPITSSYYVITLPTIGSLTGGAPEFIDAFTRIKTTDKSVVLIFFNTGGFRLKDMNYFMKYCLNMTTEEIDRVNLIVNDSVYMKVTQGRHLARVQYYFRGNLIYDEADKWHKSKHIFFPSESINLNLKEKIKLVGIDSLLVKERDNMYSYKDGKFFLLTDSKNELCIIEPTGAVKSTLNISKLFKASDLYCKYIANGDTSKCNYTKLNEARINSLNRKTVSLDGMQYLGNDSLFLSISIEVIERNEEEYQFINDEGVKTIFKKGEPTLNVYTFAAFYTLNDNAIKLFLCDEYNDNKGEDKYITYSSGILFKNEKIIAPVHGYGKKDNNTTGVVELKFENNKLIPDKLLLPVNIYDEKLYMYGIGFHFFNFIGQDFFSYAINPDIFKIGRQNKQSSFFGNGSAPYEKEVFMTYFQEVVDERINFLIHDIQPILNGQYLAAYINYKGKPILEIKNRMLKTVDVIDLTQYPEIAHYHANKYRYDLIINDNKIIVKTIEDDEIYLNIFEITPFSE